MPSKSSCIARHPAHAVAVGPVLVGGGAPIVVQSMTNTDIEATRQVAQLTQAGSELVRITVNSEEAARAVPAIREKLDGMGLATPLIGDFHFNGHKLLTNNPACAEALAKYRINPGNVGPKRARKGKPWIQTRPILVGYRANSRPSFRLASELLLQRRPEPAASGSVH